MMKKRLRLLFLACLIIVLASCGGTKEESKNNDGNHSKAEVLVEVSPEARETNEPKAGVAAKDEEGSKKVHEDLLTSKDLTKKKILYEDLKMNEAKTINQVKMTVESIPVSYTHLTLPTMAVV